MMAWGDALGVVARQRQRAVAKTGDEVTAGGPEERQKSRATEARKMKTARADVSERDGQRPEDDDNQDGGKQGKAEGQGGRTRGQKDYICDGRNIWSTEI